MSDKQDSGSLDINPCVFEASAELAFDEYSSCRMRRIFHYVISAPHRGVMKTQDRPVADRTGWIFNAQSGLFIHCCPSDYRT